MGWAAVPVTLMVAVSVGSSRTAARFRRMRAGSVDRETEPLSSKTKRLPANS
ncbi:hypothetical protein D3C80_1812780 [compost metagenome]